MSDDTGADPRRWRVLVVLLVAIFMSLVNVGIVNVALPSIRIGLDAGESQLQWVLAGYALTFGVLLVAAGRAGDVYGRGFLFIAGVAVFTLSSIWAGLAHSAYELDAARFVQGIGSGLFSPQSIGMIQQYFRGEERGRAFGAYGASVGVAVAAGPVIGGLIIESVGVADGWRWTMLVNVPVGLLAIVLAFRWFPRPLFRRPERAGPAGAPAKIDLDVVGALLLGSTIFAVMFPFVETRGGVLRWVVLGMGGLLAVGWVAWEQRYRLRGHAPMVDLAIFRTASFANGTSLITLYFMGATSIWVLVALYLQEGLGYSALAAGAIGVPNAIASALTAVWAGRVVVRKGRIVVVTGLVMVLAGIALSIGVLLLHRHGTLSILWLLVTLAVVGAGQGAVITPNQTLTLSQVPLAYAGSSGGILQTGQRVGTSVGIALITALLFARLGGLTGDAAAWTTATVDAFVAVMAAILLALVFGIRDLRAPADAPVEPEGPRL